MTNDGFTKEVMLNFVDEQVELLNESQKLNFNRWNILNKKQFLQPAARGSYEAEIKYLKEFIENRFSTYRQIVNSSTTSSGNEKVEGGWIGRRGRLGVCGWRFPGWRGNNGGDQQWPNWGGDKIINK